MYALDIVALRAFRSGVHTRGIRTSSTFALDKLASIEISARLCIDLAGLCRTHLGMVV